VFAATARTARRGSAIGAPSHWSDSSGPVQPPWLANRHQIELSDHGDLSVEREVTDHPWWKVA
jgi:hypothetical protein